jgi:hypothetical protein
LAPDDYTIDSVESPRNSNWYLVLMAARSYLYMRYVKGQGAGARLPEKVIKTYMRLVRSGLN